MGNTVFSNGNINDVYNDTCTVRVSKEDKEALLYHIGAIQSILEKYPYTNDYSVNFVTSMSRVKTMAESLSKWIEILPSEQ